MTREECENEIYQKMVEIWDIYKKYNKDGEYLSLCVCGDSHTVSNSYYDKDIDKPINGAWFKGRRMNVW